MEIDNQNCHGNKFKIDYMLCIESCILIFLYLIYYFYGNSFFSSSSINVVAATSFELINKMWWSLLIGIITIGILSQVPKRVIIAALGTNKGVTGIIRATFAGILLDLCSHGILMVASKIYERGASTGQVIAFLVASPWNSLSFTVILISLIGTYWTIIFILLSAIIAVISGIVFDILVAKKILPENKNSIELPKNFSFIEEIKEVTSTSNFSMNFIKKVIINGVLDSRMVIRWVLFGILLAGIVRAFLDSDDFVRYFGPSMFGLGATIIVATILEICSEGSSPIAADILTKANAPGNGFAFLMTGVSTDYTEIMVLKETTKSWKIALFLPLISLPQIILFSYFMNNI